MVQKLARRGYQRDFLYGQRQKTISMIIFITLEFSKLGCYLSIEIVFDNTNKGSRTCERSIEGELVGCGLVRSHPQFEDYFSALKAELFSMSI